MPIPLGILAVAGAGAGGGGSFDLLETTLISSDTASVTFSNLNNYLDYKHLQIRAVTRTTNEEGVRLRLNSDSGSNYALHTLFGNGTSVVSSGAASQAQMTIGWTTRDDDDPASAFGALVCDILDFGNSSKNTTIRSLTGKHGNSSRIVLYSGLWNNTAAVTSFQIFPSAASFKANSRFSLYGIK